MKPGPASFRALLCWSLAGCASVRAPDAPPPVAPPADEGEKATTAATGEAPLGAAPAPSVTEEHAAPPVTASASAAPPPAPAPTAAPAAPADSGERVGASVALELSEPKFGDGEVPKAKAALTKLSKALKACVDDNGGLSQPTGRIEIAFLVRAAGVAEGVDVSKASGVTDAAKRCVVKAIQKRSMGTPSTDPVGVTVVLTLRPETSPRASGK